MQGKVSERRTGQDLSPERFRLRPEAIVLVQMLFGYGLACLCFLAGIPLGGWQFWASLACGLGLAAGQSKRTFRLVAGLNALMFLLTLYTFTYHHCDAGICHLPMSRFFEEGWNPVRDCSLDAVIAHFNAHGITSGNNGLLEFEAYHVLLDPKFVQILAAQLQAGCGLFTAAAYPLWFTVFALAATAYRTARQELSLPVWAAATFAAMVCCNLELTVGSLQGQVDLVTYNAVAIAALSLVLWRRSKALNDLVTFFTALTFALTSKFNGVFPSVLLLGLAAWFGRRDRDMRRGLLVFAGAFALFGLLPYWTAAYWFGSPLYPAHTFRAGVPLPDLTFDFVGLNEEARQMGYFGRMVYAWVSPRLALWGCRLWYANPDFIPVWRWGWLTEGGSAFQCACLWSGVLASFFCRRNALALVTWAIFLTFFLLPTRYVGFTRYAAHVHLAVILAWFNCASGRPQWFRRGVWTACAALAVALVVGAYRDFLRQLRTEAVLQRNIRMMRWLGVPYTLDSADDRNWTWALPVRERLALDGLDVGFDEEGAEPLGVDWNMALLGRGCRWVWQHGYRWPDNVSKPKPLWK